MNEDKRHICRFAAGVALVACAYFGGSTVSDMVSAASTGTIDRPDIMLTSGEVIDPETAPAVTKYDKSTAKDFAQMIFEDAETAPDINEFLSRFMCDTCGKGCLLTAPFCFVGKGNQEKAVELYQEMYPDIEVFIASMPFENDTYFSV